jgi:hypothetical protein
MMDGDAGGWLWLLIDVFMVAALAAGLIYATVSWSWRRRSTARASQQSTKRLYEQAAADEEAEDRKRQSDGVA